MAVLARAQITLSAVVDIQAVYKYYKLQSSTSTKPSKPTSISTLPPSGWTATEPTYTSGSTNTLYTVELTVFTDGSFSYSDVMTDSAYEAAKAAYNKAVAAANAAAAAQDDIDAQKEWFWHDSTGAHILGDETGYRNDLNSSGMHIVDTSTETEIARFGADGAQIGPDDKVHTVTDANGIRYYGLKYNQGVPSGTKMIANIGCTENQGLPYFVFGSTFNNPAFGDYSMTEGYANEATGDCAHAEGEAVRAKGRASHAGGDHTIAGSKHQMAIGRYNIEDTNEDYSFIIGNGKVSQGVTIRANALTVDWSGNVVIAGGLTANADIEVTGDLSATGNINAGGDATITGDLTAKSVTTGSDIDWTELMLNSACVAYSSVTVPHYKRRGDMVTVIGDVKPSAAVAAQSTLTIGQLPAECCPPQRISLLCQGSTTAVWYMQIATDGTITASRYRTEAGYQAMATNTWLPFAITFMV